MTFNRRVVGLTPALAATQGPWTSPLPAVACALRRETPIQYSCCSRERLCVVEDLKGRYRNSRMNELQESTQSNLATRQPQGATSRHTGNYERRTCPRSLRGG